MENVDRCICCGEIVPEGQMACPNCMVTVNKDEKFTLIGGQRGGGQIFRLKTVFAVKDIELKEAREEAERWKSAALFYREKAMAAPQWIPVTAWMPGRYKTVIGWTSDREMGEVQYDGRNFVWADDDGLNDYAKVTHWMPMPEPPKEESQ